MPAPFSPRSGTQESCNGTQPLPGSLNGILLKHHEFETLLHEFGHAVHMFLSRTRYQNVSGYRGPLDFVETPSNLMEKFCYDYRYLRFFAKHYMTGKPIPAEMVINIRKSKRMFHALDTLESLYRAKVDQLLFGPQPYPSGSHQKLVHATMADLLPIQIPDEPLWQTRFEHFYHYAGGYYSYLYGVMFAEQVWNELFEADPLCQAAGERYRKSILEPGASRDPSDMLKDVLSDPELDISLGFKAGM